MGKRSNFERIERDFYQTPKSAVEPLLPHLKPRTPFDEPCAGAGALIRHLEAAGHICTGASDIAPATDAIATHDVFDIDSCEGEFFITNPPWERSILHPMIEHLSNIAPTWLLFDADWVHTKQSVPYIHRLAMIVSVGRVKWIPDSKMTGKDNCAWHLFAHPDDGPWHTRFYGRR